MSPFSRSLRELFPNFMHVLGAVLFFLAAVLLYEPRALADLMHTGESNLAGLTNVWSFNISIVTAIIFVSTLFSRMLFCLLKNRLEISWFWYGIWCLVEIIATSAFVALYMALISGGSESWFYFLGQSLGSVGSILIFPYLIISMAYGWRDAAIADPASDEGTRLKFYDNRHLLKFVTTTGSVLYIESNENYVNIHYLENGAVRKFQLRSSMKALDPLCDKAGFVRAHRCYFLNPKHIKTIRKDEEGLYYANLDAGAGIEIPISKKYYSNLVSLL